MKNLNKEMQERIASLTDKALVEMLESKPGDYVNEALIIGNQEAEQRGGLELIKSKLVEMYRKDEDEIERLKQLEREEEEKKWEEEAEEVRSNSIIADQMNQQLITQQIHSNSSNSLLTIAIVLLVLSATMALGGYNYTQNHKLDAIGRVFGYSDNAYEIANWCLNLGIVIFLVGIGLLIGAFVKRQQVIVIQQKQILKCQHNGENGIYCSICGEKINQ